MGWDGGCVAMALYWDRLGLVGIRFGSIGTGVDVVRLSSKEKWRGKVKAEKVGRVSQIMSRKDRSLTK